jgi:Arc/MetJ-type ribon-helix-helix transcriptional regulator
MTTKPTQVRLTDRDKAKLDSIRERFGLPSRAAAIRYAIDRLSRQGDDPGKTRKIPGEGH